MRKFICSPPVVLGLCLFAVSQAKAVVVTEVLDVEVIAGPGTGTMGTISVEFDDILLTGAGAEQLAQTEVDLELDLFGQIFGNADDIDFPGFPVVDFFDGVITFINFVISEGPGTNPIAITDPAIDFIAGGDVIGGTWLVSTDP